MQIYELQYFDDKIVSNSLFEVFSGPRGGDSWGYKAHIVLDGNADFLQKGKGNTIQRLFMRQPHHRSAEVWHALSGISQYYLPPTRLSANGMNYVFAFPAQAGSHFTDPGGMKG